MQMDIYPERISVNAPAFECATLLDRLANRHLALLRLPLDETFDDAWEDFGDEGGSDVKA